MINTLKIFWLFFISSTIFIACNNINKSETIVEKDKAVIVEKSINDKISQWKEIELKADLSLLNDNEKEMIRLFLQASNIIDNIFWKQAFYGNKDEFLSSITDADTQLYASINYGPWDRLDGRNSFIKNFNRKPLGANFYPQDIKYLPFISYQSEGKLSAYTLIRRDDNGDLFVEPYNRAYEQELNKISVLLKKAAELSDNKSFSKYLISRADALISNKYFDSEVAWMDIKNSNIDFLIGPVETYEDNFLQIKAAFESYILLKDNELSDKMQHYAELVDAFQQCIPCDESYKKAQKAINAEFGVYYILNYSGYANVGGKNISINRPYDLQVLKEYGSKKLQFKNVMEAKFDNILLPIANIMIEASQVKLINADIFFKSTMLYEIAEQLGFHKTLSSKNIKDELKDYYTIIEKTRSDIVRLLLVSELYKAGQITEEDIKKHYITYVSNLFRIVRLGDAETQAKADMIIFNYLQDNKAIIRTEEGLYKVDATNMKKFVIELTTLIYSIEENGDYAKAKELVKNNGYIKDELKKDLNKIQEAGIPIDLRFKQGVSVLGL